MRYIQVITTTDKKTVANAIAKALAGERLAACIQAWPITSTFRWEGKVRTAKEWIILAKARSPDYGKIEKRIMQLHNYELPEIIAVPILEGSPAYLRWISKSAKAKGR